MLTYLKKRTTNLIWAVTFIIFFLTEGCYSLTRSSQASYWSNITATTMIETGKITASRPTKTNKLPKPARISIRFSGTLSGSMLSGKENFYLAASTVAILSVLIANIFHNKRNIKEHSHCEYIIQLANHNLISLNQTRKNNSCLPKGTKVKIVSHNSEAQLVPQ